MGAIGLAQPLALSTPLSNSQLPFPLFVNGNEISSGTSGADATTYRLSDQGFSGPQTFTFTIPDHTGSVSAWIAKQQRVLWYDSAGARYLFQGYVKNIARRVQATYTNIDVTAVDLSESLDTAIPIQLWDAGAHGSSDQAEIQALLANYLQDASVYGSGGFVQVLNGAMPSSLPTNQTTLRNAIDAVLKATGVGGAVSYVDALGLVHTLAIGDVSAPYTISDAPDFVTSVSAHIETTDQGEADVDAIYVLGGTALGSGSVYAWQCGFASPPRSPLRWATLDAPQAVDAATLRKAATVEFQRRQGGTTATIIVTGFDGWAKGQLLTVTSSPLGWSGKQLIISAVDMSVISGTGVRVYTLTAGSDPVLFSARLKYMHAQWKHLTGSTRIRGRLGGAQPA